MRWPPASRVPSAFTLIEFILVMALLAVVIAVAAPSLSNFFRGRKLESEAGRFVALTRYGQNLAVSEGSPMILWLDRTEGTYGLREQEAYAVQNVPLQSTRLRERAGYEPVHPKQPEFRLAENLRFELDESERNRTNGRIVSIRFLPDGAIEEGSLRALLLQRENRDKTRGAKPETIWITRSRDQSRYEVVDETNVWERIHWPSEATGGLYLR